MFKYAVKSVNVYRSPRSYSLNELTHPWIMMQVSGMDDVQLTTPRYKYRFNLDAMGPCLMLGFPGLVLRAHCRYPFENWVIELNGGLFREANEKERVEFRFGKQWLPAPLFLPLPAERVPGFQAELNQMLACIPLDFPRHQVRAWLGVAHFLRYIVDQQTDQLHTTPAGQLKKLIDTDESFSKTLAELSGACGYTGDHLRLLFKTQYGLGPLAYRHNKKNALAMDLIANSTLPLKQIAAATGFKNFSHFSNFFHKAFGMSPGEGIKRFRH